MTHLYPHTVFLITSCLLLMNRSGLATVHLTFPNGISVNIHATAEAKFKGAIMKNMNPLSCH